MNGGFFSRLLESVADPFACVTVLMRDAMEPANPTQVASKRYCFVKEPSVIVWLPPASIANTSNGCDPWARDPTNSGGTVTLCVKAWVAGTVTWNEPTMTWWLAC